MRRTAFLPDTKRTPLLRTARAIVCALICCLIWAGNGMAGPHPLEPVNTAGPRATLRSFLMNVDAAYEEFEKSGYRTENAMKFMSRAASTMDLSQVAPALREEVGFESSLLLKEIIDSIDTPPLESLPGAEDFGAGKSPAWRFPHTEITIARVDQGPRKGAWLFTAETVSRIGDYYEIIREIDAPDKTPGKVYEAYIYSPGRMIPPGLIRALPDWMQTNFLEQALWQWTALCLILLAGTAAIFMSHRLLRRCVGSKPSDERLWRLERLFFPILALFITHFLDYFIDEQINITGSVLAAVHYLTALVMLIFGSWLILTVGNTLIRWVTHYRNVKLKSIDANVIALAIRLISIAGVFILFYNMADFIGLPVTAVFASAGVAGVAVALAAKDSLSNLFGGVAIFMDRPFRIGDYIILDTGERGEVMQVGMRSTRILTRDDIMITIPNTLITNVKVVNQSSPKPMFRVRMKIGVAYDSDVEHVERILMEEANSSPLAASTPEPRVRLRAFGDSSLDYELLCWAKRPEDQGKLLHTLSTSVFKRFKAEGIEIPFPQRDVNIKE